jgi:hypothetical protein
MTTNINNNSKISEVVNRICVNMRLNYESLSEEAVTQISNFLVENHKNEFGIRVVFTREEPKGDYEFATVKSGERILVLAYGKNEVKDKYPNVLFVLVRKTPEATFKNFWKRRGLPEVLFEEVLKNVCLTEKVTIMAYKSTAEWNKDRKRNGKCKVFGEFYKFVPNRCLTVLRTAAVQKSHRGSLQNHFPGIRTGSARRHPRIHRRMPDT